MAEQKTILVCGYGGIGRAIVKKLLLTGSRLVVLDSSSLSAEDRKLLDGSVVVQADLTDEAQLRAALDGLKEIDGIVFAAASKLIRKKLIALSQAELRADFEVNFFGFFNLCSALLPKLIERRVGTIVALTSSILEPNVQIGSVGGYGPAKFALRGMLRQFAQELAPYNIRVNAVAPNFVRTPLQQDVPQRADSFIKEKNPLNTMTTPEDVADVVAWLLSEGSNSLTGVSIPVTFGECVTL